LRPRSIQLSDAIARLAREKAKKTGPTRWHEVVLAELVACDSGLDYAVSRVDIVRAPLEFAATAAGSVTTESNIAVNIVQHPDGRPKRFGIRDNLVTGATDRDLRYFNDTEGGSSGSPVLSDEWKVVALHRGSTFARGVQYQGRATAYVNLGTQIHAIFGRMRLGLRRNCACNDGCRPAPSDRRIALGL
jgi:hypothetical protein